MRKAFCAILLSACALPAPAALRVVTSLQDFASIADAVGGKRVETFALARGYQDPHFVEPKPSFVLKLSKADLLIVAGLELEIGYLPPLVDQSRNDRIRPGSAGYLDASTGCDILERPTGVVTRAMGDVHPFGNPHFWLDPANGRVIARAIAARLTQLDPAGSAEFKANLAAFETALTEGEKRWDVALGPYAGTELVTYHNSWPNFLKRFKLTAAGYIEPKPGIPASPAHTVEIVNLIRHKNSLVILMEPYFDSKAPRSVAQKTGARLLTLIPSVGGVPEVKD
ncbi:MAG: metal ABC transporter substrate-binding protein, partial [Thermoanaerobaculia bacterium]